MTSIRDNYVWTPQLIEQDKALKEKYGPSAHIIPMKESDYKRNGLQVPKMKPALTEDTVEIDKYSNKKHIRIAPSYNTAIIDNPFIPGSPSYNPALLDSHNPFDGCSVDYNPQLATNNFGMGF